MHDCCHAPGAGSIPKVGESPLHSSGMSDRNTLCRIAATGRCEQRTSKLSNGAFDGNLRVGFFDVRLARRNDELVFGLLIVHPSGSRVGDLRIVIIALCCW